MGKTLLFIVKKDYNLFLFYAEGHSRFSATLVVPVALPALGTFQGPGVMGVFLAGEPGSGLGPLPPRPLSAASRSFSSPSVLFKTRSSGSGFSFLSEVLTLSPVLALLELVSPAGALFPLLSDARLATLLALVDGGGLSPVLLLCFSGDAVLFFPG